MNWDAIAAVAEALGVIGVIVSIVYLGIQVRHSNQVAEDAAFKNTLTLGISSHHEMIEGENRDIVINGLLNYKELSGREKLVFDNVMTSWFTVVASALFSRRLGFIDEEHTETLGYILRSRFFPYRGIHSWWHESKGIFSSEAQRWFEEEMSKADMAADFYRIKNGNQPQP